MSAAPITLRNARRYVANQIFGRDPRVRSVGIGRLDGRSVFIAMRNSDVILPFSQTITPVDEVGGTPVV